MEPAQLQREETQQDLRTGNSVTFYNFSSIIIMYSWLCDSAAVYSDHKHFSTFSIFQAMAIINGYLYVFGGTTGYLYSTDLHRLDLTTREWTHLKPNNAPTDLPEERSDSRDHFNDNIKLKYVWLKIDWNDFMILQVQTWVGSWWTENIHFRRWDFMDVISPGQGERQQAYSYSIYIVLYATSI